MNFYKLRKTDFKEPTALLERMDLVENNRAYPDRLIISNEDYSYMEKEVTKMFKKQYPYLKETKLKSAVGWHMLNYGPKKSSALKVSHVIVLDKKTNNV